MRPPSGDATEASGECFASRVSQGSPPDSLATWAPRLTELGCSVSGTSYNAFVARVLTAFGTFRSLHVRVANDESDRSSSERKRTTVGRVTVDSTPVVAHTLVELVLRRVDGALLRRLHCPELRSARLEMVNSIEWAQTGR
jgi:hypothetical protein